MSSKYDDDSKEDEGKFDEGKYCYANSGVANAGERGLAKDNAIQESVNDDEIISKVQEFVFANDKLATTFEDFVKERAHMIDLTSTEYKLGYTQIHDEFKSLFENYLEEFIVNDMGCSIQRFYNVLKSKTDENADCNEAVFGQILLAVCDFDVFMTMMKEEAIASSRK